MSGPETDRAQMPVLPFYYGGESESFTFIKVPKILFSAQAYMHLTPEAKLLYAILLDRMHLSAKNRWFDPDGKVFIYFPQQRIMEVMSCGMKKAGQLLAELDDRSGAGLITRTRQGQGRPDKIYVHKCVIPGIYPEQRRAQCSSVHAGPEPFFSVTPGPGDGIFIPGTGAAGMEDIVDFCAGAGIPDEQGVGLRPFQTCQNDHSGIVETASLTGQKSHSGLSEKANQDLSKPPCNKNENNKKERSDTYLIESYPDSRSRRGSSERAYEPSDTLFAGRSDRYDGYGQPTFHEKYREFRAFFEESCCFDYLRRENPMRTEMLSEILTLLTETCCTGRNTIRVGGDEKPADVVRSRFMKLESGHIQYVLDCLCSNTTKVRNIRQYLLTALYNAPVTIDSYYTAEVNHDLYGQET